MTSSDVDYEYLTKKAAEEQKDLMADIIRATREQNLGDKE